MKDSLRLQRGFTVIELIDVIVLLGILSATVLPKFFEKSGYKERVMFDDTLSAVRYAQKLAVATGCNMQFSISSNAFQILHANTCSSTNYGLAVAHPATQTPPYTGSESGISLPDTTITFNAIGEAVVSNNITIGSKMINIVPATGFIYVSP